MSDRPGRPRLKVQLDVALRQLGLDPKTAILDHTPPLALRLRTVSGGYIPDADDPRYLQWLSPEANRRKTIGTPATTAGSDIHAIAKIARLDKLPKLRGRDLQYDPTTDGVKVVRPWPKGRKLQSRPFEARKNR